MFNRKFVLGGILASAAFVPYVMNNKELANSVRALVSSSNEQQTPAASANFWDQLTSAASSNSTATPTSAENNSWSPWNLLSSDNTSSSTNFSANFPPPAAVPASIEYSEILRFDLQPESILQRFPRVTMVSAEENMSGLRVPIMTGPRPDDLAGSLTYYFDNQRLLKRIIMQGSTGDPRRLVTLVTSQHQFQPLPSLSAGLYIAVKNNQPQSLLQITYAPVIQATDLHNKTAIVLELNRPGVYLSPAGRQLLEEDKQLSRW